MVGAVELGLIVHLGQLGRHGCGCCALHSTAQFICVLHGLIEQGPQLIHRQFGMHGLELVQPIVDLGIEVGGTWLRQGLQEHENENANLDLETAGFNITRFGTLELCCLFF